MSESHEVEESSSDIIVQETASKIISNKRSKQRSPLKDSKIESKPLLKDDAVGSTDKIDLKTTSKKSINKIGVQKIPT